MKKRVFLSIVIFIIGIILVGCNKTKDDINWELDKINNVVITDDAINVFNSVNSEYKPIALLGKQVVAGTNYMYLCLDNNSNDIKNAYKVMVIYKNLEGKTSITSITDFNIFNYVNENISNNYGNIDGGWSVLSTTANILDENVQDIFDEAINKVSNIKYIPIGVLAHQDKSGTNYALLCYGNINNKEGIYLITLYEDLHGTREIVSSAYVDLATFNR